VSGGELHQRRRAEEPVDGGKLAQESLAVGHEDFCDRN
jgi:hypothetical protein